MVEWFKKAPTGVVITLFIIIGVFAVASLGGFVYLSAIGANTTEYRTFINTILNYGSLGVSGFAAIAATSAARSAGKVEDRTNGGLEALVDRKIRERNGDGK